MVGIETLIQQLKESAIQVYPLLVELHYRENHGPGYAEIAGAAWEDYGRAAVQEIVGSQRFHEAKIAKIWRGYIINQLVEADFRSQHQACELQEEYHPLLGFIVSCRTHSTWALCTTTLSGQEPVPPATLF